MSIQNDSFVLGERAVATCISLGDLSNIAAIIWEDEAGNILANATGQTQLDVVFDIVHESLSEIRCRVIANEGAEVAKTLQISLISKILLHVRVSSRMGGSWVLTSSYS